jgi:hypothetical protein
MKTAVSADKAIYFVKHIQTHLDNEEYGGWDLQRGRMIPKNKVGCKICEKSIDRIWAERKRKVRDAKQETEK